MNLVTSNQNITMSSREIAELVNQRHDNVKRTIETLGTKGVISHPQIEDGQKSANGVVEKIYQLGKRDSLIVVAQLCPEFTAKIVDRWQELETQQSVDPMKILNDPAAMRGLLLGYTEKVLELESTVAELAPKAEALDMISAGKDTLTTTEAAKVLGVKRIDLTTRLHAEGWWYRQNGSWVAYDKFIKNGCLQYKEANYTDEKTGMKCVKPYCHVTQKGLTRLAQMFGGAA